MPQAQQQDQRYNGWANYPTWAVELWLSNDEGLYEQAREMAQDAFDAAPDDQNVSEGVWTVEQAMRFNLADAFRKWVETVALAPMDNPEAFTGMTGDLVQYALGEVDWEEIAASWLDSLEA